MYYPRESQRDYLYTRNIILIIFSLVAGLVASFTLDNASSYGLIEAYPIKTNAKIIKIEPYGHGYYNLRIHYSFTTKDSVNYQGVFKSNNSNTNSPMIGESVSIIYSGLSPKYNDIPIKHEGKSYSFYIFISNIVIILLSMFFVFRTSKKIQKHKEEDKYY